MNNLTHTLPDGTEIEVNEPRWELTDGWHGFNFVTKVNGRICGGDYECEADIDYDLYRVPYVKSVRMSLHGRDGYQRQPVPDYLTGIVAIAAEIALADAWGYKPNLPQTQAAE